ncbi:penicillin-binding protein 2 [Endomicrobiia bacterium]|nr:penicillin-binding protein 2 [Endomicrobiia bacterium]
MVWQKEGQFAYKTFLKKHKVILVFFSFLFVCLSIRLFYLQIIKGDGYIITSQQQCLHNTYEHAPRGIIYSASNAVLVDNEFTYVVLYRPYDHHQNTSEQIIKELSKILGREIKPVVDKGLKYGKVVMLVDNLTKEEMFKIEEKNLSLKGVSVVKDFRRIYSYPEITGHITGYTSKISLQEVENLSEQGYKMGDYIGKGGIEQAYDKYLQGKDGGWKVELNARGHQVKAFKYVAPEIGADVYSTIDLKLQKVAYDALKDSDAGKGAAVVLDAKTGAVKALVSCPGFDTNKVRGRDFEKYSKDDKNLPLFNRALQAHYPPGSIFKIVTFAAATDILSSDSLNIIHCAGSFELGDRHYACWCKQGHGKLNLISAMAQSCNIYFYQLGLKLGIKNLEKYAKKFYFGKKTGIDLPNEKEGFIPNPEWKKSKSKLIWLQGDTVIFAIGQGALCATPLQMACMISAIANNGVCRKPYIVDRAVNISGNEVYKYELGFDDKLELTHKTWKLLHKALLETVENGTGKKCKLPGIKVAGKTGTAENPQGKDHGWFVSYAPADNPEIAMAIFVEHGGGGGLNAVPIGRKIYKAYFNIANDKEEKVVKQ